MPKPGLLSLPSFLLAGGTWELLSRLEVVNPVLLPPLSTVIVTLWGLLVDGSVHGPLLSTLALLFAGYLLACIVGIALGLAMGVSDRVFHLLEPSLEFLRPIPKPALVPLLFLMFGIGSTTMVLIVFLAAVFPVLINTIQGVRGVDGTLLQTARTFRTGTTRTVLLVILPAAVPLISAGMRVSLGLGLSLTVLAEVLAGDGGVGYLVLDMQRGFRIPQMYAWVLVLAVVGCGLAALFDLLERRLIPWKAK